MRHGRLYAALRALSVLGTSNLALYLVSNAFGVNVAVREA
jgi:hypothetical protein